MLPQHRGRRLGLLVKIEMMRVLAVREPQARRIVVRNAGANEHMVAINEQLGYRVTAIRRDWELDLARARRQAWPTGASGR